jgi:hypothetical protein
MSETAELTYHANIRDLLLQKARGKKVQVPNETRGAIDRWLVGPPSNNLGNVEAAAAGDLLWFVKWLSVEEDAFYGTEFGSIVYNSHVIVSVLEMYRQTGHEGLRDWLRKAFAVLVVSQSPQRRTEVYLGVRGEIHRTQDIYPRGVPVSCTLAGNRSYHPDKSTRLPMGGCLLGAILSMVRDDGWQPHRKHLAKSWQLGVTDIAVRSLGRERSAALVPSLEEAVALCESIKLFDGEICTVERWEDGEVVSYLDKSVNPNKSSFIAAHTTPGGEWRVYLPAPDTAGAEREYAERTPDGLRCWGRDGEIVVALREDAPSMIVMIGGSREVPEVPSIEDNQGGFRKWVSTRTTSAKSRNCRL